MKVLKILNSHDDGGVFTCEVQFIKELTRQGIVIDAVIIGDGKSKADYVALVKKSYFVPDLNVAYVGSPLTIIGSIYKSFVFGLRQARILKPQIPNVYDSLIYRRPVYIFLAGILGNFISKTRFWHLPNTVNSKFSRQFYTIFCKKYDIIPVANSSFTRKTLPMCKDVIYPGFDDERVNLDTPYYRDLFKIDPSIPVYGMVARICYDKAQDILIESFIQSKPALSGAHLLIAGGCKDDVFMEKLKMLSGKYLNTQIHFLGVIHDLPKFYSSVNIVVNSRRNVEAFGISIAEALGAGKPVMAYKLGGPSEMIKNADNGWLVSEPNVESFKQGFNLTSERSDSWEEMGKNAERSSKLFSVNTNVTNMIKLISKYKNAKK